MRSFSPVTDADIARAQRSGVPPEAARQSLEALLAGMKKLRRADPSGGAHAGQLREGVELTVRLAEIIQDAGGRSRF